MDSETDKAKAKPWQFSLRALFVVMTLAALWAAVWRRNPNLAVQFAAMAVVTLIPEALAWMLRRQIS